MSSHGLRLTAPEDRQRSPFTGFTRAHWIESADRQLHALRPYFAQECTRVALPGRTSWSGADSDGLEGYARSFLLAACRVAGARGDPERHLDFYRRGLVTGTDRRSPAPWPDLRRGGQPVCEAASIAVALHLTRPWLWDELDLRQQERIGEWLQGARGVAVAENNWVMFRMIIQRFLASVGLPFDQADIDIAMDRIGDWYRGDGWFTDGPNKGFDYYNAWAFHLYPAIAAWMAGADDPAWASDVLAESRLRLRRFVPSHAFFFGANGSPIFHGRSLTYRFASVAPLWFDALLGVDALPPGMVRRIASGALRYFTDGGAADDRGLLTLGWLGPDERVLQPYSGAGSPYWAAKAFLGLLLPEDHPVWLAEEEPGPNDIRTPARRVVAAGILLAPARGGIARLLRHGIDQPVAEDPEDGHYTRLAYSSHTAPTSAPDLPDNHFAVIAEGVSSFRAEIRSLPAPALAHAGVLDDATISSSHAPHWPGLADPPRVLVHTASAVDDARELRVHVVLGGDALQVRETGYAVSADHPEELTSSLTPLSGYTAHGVVFAPSGTPLTKAGARVPWLEGRCRSGREIFVSLVELLPATDATDSVSSFVLEDRGDVVVARVAFEGGGELTAAVTAVPQ